jgi:hypothetical protein
MDESIVTDEIKQEKSDQEEMSHLGNLINGQLLTYILN